MGDCLQQESTMTSVNFITGDATQPVGDGPKVLVHVCNDRGGWGKGFVVAISKRWVEPEAAYRRWHTEGGDPPFELGSVQFVKVEQNVWVANLIGQHGIARSGGKPPVRYEAIQDGLARVAAFALQHQATIHMPRIGCGLAGGRWEEIEPILHTTLIDAGIAVTVYDFAPADTKSPRKA
jgi:O-acetyl-ADP-ribose deacetylase (regulator of RNase III)